MDVTGDNFVEALAIFRANLPNAEFVAVDLEFTGLGESRPSQLDTPAVRYSSASADAERFPPVQVGVALFRRVRKTKENVEDGERTTERREENQNNDVESGDVEMRDVGTGDAQVSSADSADARDPNAEDASGACGDGERGADVDQNQGGEIVGEVREDGGAGELDGKVEGAERERERETEVEENGKRKAEEKTTGERELEVEVEAEKEVRVDGKGEEKGKGEREVEVEVEVEGKGEREREVEGKGEREEEEVDGGNPVDDELEEGQVRENKVEEAVSEKVEWEWQVIPFNFNVFPRAFYFPANSRYPTWDRVFNLQSSTVQFLLRHGFDFMKIFSGGVSWVREDVEKDIRDHVKSRLTKLRADRSKALPKAGKKLIAKYRKFIDDWLETLEKETGIKTFPFPKESVQRRLIFDFVKDNYPKIHADIFLTQDGQVLRLTKYENKAQVAEKAEQALAEDVDSEVSKAIGFRYVVDAIREARVPVVAHNALLDWIKIYANFVKPAPAQHLQFKGKLREAFPFVYDTRWMLHVVSERFKDLGVSGRYPSIKDLTETVQKFVKKRGGEAVETRTFVPTSRVYRYRNHLSKGVVRYRDEGFVFSGTISDADIERDTYGFGRYSAINSDRYEHEAGYDALQTGKLFVLLLQLLESGGSAMQLDRVDIDFFARNKIWLGSCGGYKYMDLETEDRDEPNTLLEKGNAVVVTGRLKEDEISEVEQAKTSTRTRLARSLATILAGTAFDPLKTDMTIAGPETVLLALERKKDEEQKISGKRREGSAELAKDVDGVVERGEKLGLKVERYEDAIAHVDPDIKRRRCA